MDVQNKDDDNALVYRCVDSAGAYECLSLRTPRRVSLFVMSIELAGKIMSYIHLTGLQRDQYLYRD